MDNKDKSIEKNRLPNSIIMNNVEALILLENNVVEGPFLSNIIVDDVYNTLSYGINAELLVRNKSTSGNFTNNLQVNGGDIVEFKLSVTNTSTTKTLFGIQSTINITKNFLSTLGIPPIASIGSADYNSSNLNLNIQNFPPGTTAICNYELMAVYSGNLNFSGFINVLEDSYTKNKRQFNFSILPSISIINAPTSIIPKQTFYAKKLQRLIQSDIQNSFYESPISVVNGDIMEFQFSVEAGISTSMYNIKVTDELSNNLSYIPSSFSGKYYSTNTSGNIVQTDKILGNAMFNSNNATNVNGKLVGGSIEWSMGGLIGSNNFVYMTFLYFRCEVVK